MEHLNDTLFLLINAPQHPAAWTLFLARLLARYVIWAYPLILALCWLRGGEQIRRAALEAALAGILGLLISGLIGLAWQHPRPFVMGLGHVFLHHAADSSFPSDHLTFIWAVSFALMFHAASRRLGLVLAIVGLPVAWSRIYLGVHFPLDMVGAAVVAGLAAWLCARARHPFVDVVFGWAVCLYRFLFAALIRRGWLRP